MITIHENQLKDAIAVSRQILEFDPPYEIDEYQKRLTTEHLILTAIDHHSPVGFKIGYDRFGDGSFYSWMGGVLPEFRRKGIAGQLAHYQEDWAREKGFTSICLKTRRKHLKMITFLLKRGFVISEEIKKIPIEETRVWMIKEL